MPAETVVVVTPSLGVGGAEMQALHVANGFSRRGLETRLVVLKRDMTLSGRVDDAVEVVQLHAATGLRSVVKLRRALKDRQPRAVVAFQEHSILPSLIATRLAGSPKVCTIGVIQNVVTPKLKSSDVTWKSRVLLCLLPWVMRACTAVVALTQDVSDDLIENWGGRRRGSAPIFVVPNAVDLAVMKPVPDSESTAEYFVAVGRFVEQKGYDRLFDAFARYRREGGLRHLVVLGDGRLRPELEAQLDALRLREVVDLRGVIHDVQPVVAHARALVLASYWEGFGNVIIEAMACGTPVLAFACPGGPREVIQDGVNGYVVEDGDMTGYVERLHGLDSRSGERDSMRAAALMTASEYSVESVAARYWDVIEAVCRG